MNDKTDKSKATPGKTEVSDGRPSLDAPLKGASENTDAARKKKMGCVSFEKAKSAFKDGKAVRRLAWTDGRIVDPKHGGQHYAPTKADEQADDWIIL